MFRSTFANVFTEEVESSSDVSQSFQLTQSKIKGLEDKYRWKLNELGVSIFVMQTLVVLGEVILL